MSNIAFCSQLSRQDEQDWLSHISSLMDSINIIPFSQLTKNQKKEIEVAIVANPDPGEIAELIKLRWVQSLWSGTERLLTELPHDKVEVVRMVDPLLSITMAEAVLSWVLYLHRDMPQYQIQQRNKVWKQHKLVDVCDRNIGILGLGTLGKPAAQKLIRNGFSVSGWSRSPAKINGVACYHDKGGLHAMLRETDILICLLPLTRDTKGLLNKKILTILPNTSSIINFSRGQIINEEDLLYCLENGYLNHAVLDVFATEPLSPTHPFWESNNITVLPHISAPTNKVSASKLVADNILCYFKTGIIPKAVKRKDGY